MLIEWVVKWRIAMVSIGRLSIYVYRELGFVWPNHAAIYWWQWQVGPFGFEWFRKHESIMRNP